MYSILELLDPKTLELFETIKANGDTHTPVLISRMKMTRKQYYSRLTLLTHAGVICKKQMQYKVTSYGLIFAHAIELMKRAKENKWRLDALDCAPVEHRDKVLEALIDKETARILNGR